MHCFGYINTCSMSPGIKTMSQIRFTSPQLKLGRTVKPQLMVHPAVAVAVVLLDLWMKLLLLLLQSSRPREGVIIDDDISGSLG